MREAIESMGGGISISYNTNQGLYLTYRDAVEGSTTVQDVLYPEFGTSGRAKAGPTENVNNSRHSV